MPISLYVRPTVNTRGEMQAVVDAFEEALLRFPEIFLYQRAGLVVRIRNESRPPNEAPRGASEAPRGASEPSRADPPRASRADPPPLFPSPFEAESLRGTPLVDLAPEPWVREVASRVALWSTGNSVVHVPPWLASMFLARPSWRIPPLERVSETPFLRRDGSLCSEPGYDPASGVFFEPGACDFQRWLPRAFSCEDGIAASVELLEPFNDFPFRGNEDRSAVVASILSLIGRECVSGTVPLFAIGAPTPGTGKSLVVDAIATIVTGRPMPKLSPAHDDDEARKHVLAIALEGAPMVCLDNVDGAFGSEAIAAALTTPTVSGRILGRTQTITAPMRAVWFLTGNNLTFRGDLGRRVVPVNLDAQVEHPEDRAGFHHPNLLDYIRAERPRLVAAALTILRGYFLAGCPPHNYPAVGGFESWDDVIRGACGWLGLDDPWGGRDRVRAAGEPDVEALGYLLEMWHRRFGDGAVSVAELLLSQDALPNLVSGDELRVALSMLIGCRPDQVDPARAGLALRRHAERPIAGRMLVRGGARHNATLWRVVACTPTGAVLAADAARAAAPRPNAN